MRTTKSVLNRTRMILRRTRAVLLSFAYFCLLILLRASSVISLSSLRSMPVRERTSTQPIQSRSADAIGHVPEPQNIHRMSSGNYCNLEKLFAKKLNGELVTYALYSSSPCSERRAVIMNLSVKLFVSSYISVPHV